MEVVAAAPASVLVVDPLGEVFGRLRDMDLPVALWRAVDPLRIGRGPAIDLIVFAAYATIDWDKLAHLAARSPTLVVTTTYRRSEAEIALRRELIGYLDAAMAQPALERAMRGALLHGEPAFSRDLIGAWMRERRKTAHVEDGRANGLTRRQREILALIAEGATDKEIAAKLRIAPATAQKHVTNILRRLEVPNRAAAVHVVRSAAQRSRPPLRSEGSPIKCAS